MKKTNYYAHGKLLLTAEYLVLDGAIALAIPTKQGQFLEVVRSEHLEAGFPKLYWQSLEEDGTSWFKTVFDIPKEGIQVAKEANNPADKITQTLLAILQTAQGLNASFLTTQENYQVVTRLEFDRQWGLGTSSTLIATIAKWAEVDPFVLLQKSFGGSGYDIACAIHDKPILYTRGEKAPIIKEIAFDPPFKEDLFFVYRNQKKDSKEAIAHYRSLAVSALAKAKSEINTITKAILECQTIEVFEKLLTAHETILAGILQLPTVKTELFHDFSGAVKSLGGWGGDFMLATGRQDAQAYFRQKGYQTIIAYTAMII